MRVATLIPVDEKATERAQEALRKNVMFTDIDQFITMYNMNILSSSNAPVSRAAQALLDNFANLTKLNGKFIIETPTETAIGDTIKLLKDWEVLIKLKKLATLLLDEEYDLDNTKIVFNDEQQGKPFVYYPNIEGEEVREKYWAAEKIVNRTSDLANNILLQPLIHSYDEEGTACYFVIEDLIDLDDSFILEIQKELIRYSLRDNSGEYY